MTMNTQTQLNKGHSMPPPINLYPFMVERTIHFPSFGLCTPLDLKQAKILLVGDISKEKTVSILLHSWNAQIDTVADALEMIEKVYHNEYDLILIDLQMPYMNGWEAATFIRKRLTKQMPLIALSSTILDFDPKTLKIAGFNGYLYKPIRPQTLRNLISMMNINETPSNDEEDTQENLLVDIEFIKTLAGGDLSFVREIIRLFKEQTIEITQVLPTAQKNQDAKGVRDLVHKYKSSCNSIGNQKLHELCGKIEKEARNSEVDWSIVNTDCESLLPICHKIIEQIPRIQADLTE